MNEIEEIRKQMAKLQEEKDAIQEANIQLIRELAQYETAAEQWMFMYDKLKEKHEPLVAVHD